MLYKLCCTPWNYASFPWNPRSRPRNWDRARGDGGVSRFKPRNWQLHFSKKSKNTVAKTQSNWTNLSSSAQQEEIRVSTFFTYLENTWTSFCVSSPGSQQKKRKWRQVRAGHTQSSFQKIIQGHLTQIWKVPFNVFKDDAFSPSRDKLKAKRKNLVKQGKANCNSRI